VRHDRNSQFGGETKRRLLMIEGALLQLGL
jgi:hypothetical protein